MRRLFCTVLSGIPVRNYRAEVMLTQTSPAGGTPVRWTATWDKTFMRRIVHRKLEQFYLLIVSALVNAISKRSSRPCSIAHLIHTEDSKTSTLHESGPTNLLMATTPITDI